MMANLVGFCSLTKLMLPQFDTQREKEITKMAAAKPNKSLDQEIRSPNRDKPPPLK